MACFRLYCGMMKIEIVGAGVLQEVAEPVTEFDDNLAILADEMRKSMKRASGVGLAAPQVGVGKRLFVTAAPDDEFRVFVNPEILGTSVDEVWMEEGCLSVPGIYSSVKRPKKIAIQAQDLEGNFFKMKLSGFLARVFQHENDHLNGVLFIDHLDSDVLASYEKKINKLKRRSKG